MANPVTIPCTVDWCASDSHPNRDRLVHRALFGAFAGGAVHIVLTWAEFVDGRPTMGPALRLSRADASTLDDSVDLVPGEARLFAELFGLLDASEVLQFASAFRRGAETLERALLVAEKREVD
ncbi:hypothetical protein [Spirillospora sp. CA-128828]|uniref:hypothetical protein n=1 Tax=Spirillospora sp. CA-128828 TaxID=3240033 RepID=UPI003D91DD1D